MKKASLKQSDLDYLRGFKQAQKETLQWLKEYTEDYSNSLLLTKLYKRDVMQEDVDCDCKLFIGGSGKLCLKCREKSK